MMLTTPLSHMNLSKDDLFDKAGDVMHSATDLVAGLTSDGRAALADHGILPKQKASHRRSILLSGAGTLVVVGLLLALWRRRSDSPSDITKPDVTSHVDRDTASSNRTSAREPVPVS